MGFQMSHWQVQPGTQAGTGTVAEVTVRTAGSGLHPSLSSEPHGPLLARAGGGSARAEGLTGSPGTRRLRFGNAGSAAAARALRLAAAARLPAPHGGEHRASDRHGHGDRAPVVAVNAAA